MMQVQTENIPKALKQSPNFVLWRKEERDKRETKVPYQRNGRYAKSDDPTTWTNYSAAVSALINGHGKYDGIGFCLSEGTPIGIDLDHCRCPAFPGIEIIAPWATEIIKQVDSYTEASPSGKGIRIFAYGGKLPAHGRKKGLPEYGGDNCRKDAVPAFEIYESGRYLTITGNRIAWTPTDVMSRPEAIATVHKRIFSDMATDKGKPEIVRPVANMSVTDTLEKAYRSKNGEKIRALYNGNYLDYPSQSEADLALCSHLAFWFGNDSAQIDSAFRSSGLFRPKWNEKHFSSGQTYGQSVIEKAVSSCKETYQAAAAPSALIIEKPSPP
jgi:putative DNA primase/helicase